MDRAHGMATALSVLCHLGACKNSQQPWPQCALTSPQCSSRSPPAAWDLWIAGFACASRKRARVLLSRFPLVCFYCEHKQTFSPRPKSLCSPTTVQSVNQTLELIHMILLMIHFGDNVLQWSVRHRWCQCVWESNFPIIWKPMALSFTFLSLSMDVYFLTPQIICIHLGIHMAKYSLSPTNRRLNTSLWTTRYTRQTKTKKTYKGKKEMER